MNKKVLTSRGFIVLYFIFLMFSAATMFIPIVSSIFFVPWTILNILFMLNVFYAICKLKGGEVLFVSRLLLLIIMVYIIFQYVILAFFCSPFYFWNTLYDGMDEQDVYGMIFHISFSWPVVAVFLFYLFLVLLEYIARKRGDVILPMSRRKWKRLLGIFFSHIGMVLLAWLSIAFHGRVFLVLRNNGLSYVNYNQMFMEYGYWFVSCVAFVVISLCAIRSLCRKKENMTLYRYAKVTTVVLIIMWFFAASWQILYKVEIDAVDIMLLPFIIVQNIPTIVMLVLFFKAKRMCLSETVVIVDDRELSGFGKMDDFVEWKKDDTNERRI